LSSIVRIIKQTDEVKVEGEEKVTEQTLEYIRQQKDKLIKAQESLGELKKKYSYVPSTLEMDSAKRRNSLGDESLGERLLYGGQFQFLKGKPISLDLSGMVGYKINKKLHMGILATYRANLNIDSLHYKFSVPSDVYGASIFTDYFIYRNFYAHAELESKSTFIIQPDAYQNRKWVEGLLVGLGHDFTIFKKLKGGMMILFNVLHSDDSPYRTPWQFRFGFYKK